MAIDFQQIRANNPIEQVVAQYVDLKSDGNEFKACCPLHNENTPSFYVIPAKQMFHCFGCGKHGDVIDFIKEIENKSTVEAAETLGELDRLPKSERVQVKAPDKDLSAEWQPVCPVPDDAPAYNPAITWNAKHSKWSRYRPVMTWPYKDRDGRLMGYVLRLEFERDGKKEKITPTITFCRHKDTGETRWATRPFPRPRTLYGLDQLVARPNASVILVEGEKAAAAAQDKLKSMVVCTWAGGSNGFNATDFSPLDGRRVTFWPDADKPGLDAMRAIAGKINGATTKRWIDTDGLPDGFDAADVDGDMVEFCKARVRDQEPGVPHEPEPDPPPTAPPSQPPPSDPPEPPPPGSPDEPPPPEPESDPPVPDVLPAAHASSISTRVAYWRDLNLEKNMRDVPFNNVDNVVRVLSGHPAVRDSIWFDEFLGRVMHCWPTGPVREWSDADDIHLTIWLQRELGLSNLGRNAVTDGVHSYARQRVRNEVQEWIATRPMRTNGLLVDLLPIGFGTARNAYTEAVGRCWLVSIVARAFDPGCKVDTMPVFEGRQGARKSSAIEVLGGDWYCEMKDEPTSKDFFITLQGKLIVEIAEMNSFNRADVNRIKQIMSSRTDRYRAAYGRHSEDHPRRCVFAGTTNVTDWNRDETGARRFWPVACGEVDLEWIKEHRDDLFAEAYAAYKAGVAWWDVPVEDAMREQEDRRQVDPWEAHVAEYLADKAFVTVNQVLSGAVDVDKARQTTSDVKRVASCLKALGWESHVRREGKATARGWRRPGVTDQMPF